MPLETVNLCSQCRTTNHGDRQFCSLCGFPVTGLVKLPLPDLDPLEWFKPEIKRPLPPK